jgi:hypothetical protein
MSAIKQNLTKIFLSQAGLDNSEVNVKKKIFEWWKNPRDKIEGGFCLTPQGFLFLTETLGLKCYQIPFPKDFEFTTKIVLFLDQYIDCPHYYTKKEIFVFKEKKAAELMLFSGDIRKYGVAKALARQRELNS